MASPAVLRTHLESALGGRFAAELGWRERPMPELVSTGIPALDSLAGGLPRGAITEIHGPASSGCASLLASTLAAAMRRQEVCAVVDASDAFDPASAAAAGVDVSRLLWVRCGGHAEHALKAADLLIQGGGFGLVTLDLADVPARVTRRIPLAAWFRMRRAIEDTPTVMLVIERERTLKSCASLILEMRREAVAWSGTPGCSRLLGGARMRVELARRPAAAERAAFDVRAVG